MVELDKLNELYDNDLLNIQYTKGDRTMASLIGRQLSYQQAEAMCQQIGWTKYRLSAFEIIEKTNKFMKSFRNNTKGKEFWQDRKIELEFENLPGVEYNKTVDRIIIKMYKVTYIIIYGDKRAGGTYTVYKNMSSVPFAKCRSIKQVVEAIEKEDE